MTTPEPAPCDGAAYMRARRAHTVSLYFRTRAEKEHFQAQAAAMGYAKNFNAWLLQMLANATGGNVYPPGYVEGIAKDLEKTRGWLEARDQEIQELRAENKNLLRQREDLRVLLAASTGEAPDLPAQPTRRAEA